MYLIEKLFNLRRFKAGLADVKIAVLNILQKVCKKIFIPCTCDFIQSDIQSLLSDLIHIHHSARHFCISECHCYSQSLMSPYDGHICIDNKRVGKAEFPDAVFDFLIFPVAGFEFFSGIVFRRFQLCNRNHAKFCCFHLIPPVDTFSAVHAAPFHLPVFPSAVLPALHTCGYSAAKQHP